jgi:hypothetical protein
MLLYETLLLGSATVIKEFLKQNSLWYVMDFPRKCIWNWMKQIIVL